MFHLCTIKAFYRPKIANISQNPPKTGWRTRECCRMWWLHQPPLPTLTQQKTREPQWSIICRLWLSIGQGISWFEEVETSGDPYQQLSVDDTSTIFTKLFQSLFSMMENKRRFNILNYSMPINIYLYLLFEQGTILYLEKKPFSTKDA